MFYEPELSSGRKREHMEENQGILTGRLPNARNVREAIYRKQNKPPLDKDIHILILRIYDYVILQGKRDSEDVIKLRILK